MKSAVNHNAPETIQPGSCQPICSNTTLQPGVYLLPEGLQIAADGVTLDGNGATLVGTGRRGAGVTVAGHRGVTIRNLRLREYAHGIVARDAADLTLAHSQVTSTAELPANTDFLDIWRSADDPYGAGILLERVSRATLLDNDLQHQMNGLLTYSCRELTVRANNCSHNSGFGIHLFETCDSVFEDNWADFCNRYHPRDPHGPVAGVGASGHMGADSAGFVIVNRSCRNVFRRNAARCSGDGFFLAGRHENGDVTPCNDNLFEGNDGSLSPNIAFEATFSSGNIFRNNWADRCNYGFWLGYSNDVIVEDNRMLFNRQAGLAVEHGGGFAVRRNTFQSNGHGVLVWTKYVPAFFDPGHYNRTSRDWQIEHNRFVGNGCGVAIRADQDHGIRPMPPEQSGRPEMRPVDHVIRHNDFQDNRVGIHLVRADRTVIEQNTFRGNVEANIRREDDSDTQLGPNLGQAGAYF